MPEGEGGVALSQALADSHLKGGARQAWYRAVRPQENLHTATCNSTRLML